MKNIIEKHKIFRIRRATCHEG